MMIFQVEQGLQEANNQLAHYNYGKEHDDQGK